jgi:hypothetical protein
MECEFMKAVKTVKAYEEFKSRVKEVLEGAGRPLTWAEVRERAGFAQKFPNNVWVRKMEEDIGLMRERVKGKIYWRLK